MKAEGSELARNKRLILCSDGTWLSSNIGTCSIPSNVAKMARAVAPTGVDDEGRLIKQVVSYHSGLGTGDLPLQQAIYGGLGLGLDNDVCQIYDFISNNWEEGDELFFFGFSRGAFTVRAVVGLISDVGILPPVKMSKFCEMWEAYRANVEGDSFKESFWYRKNKERLGLVNATIKVVGVWDTVQAQGLPNWPVVRFMKSLRLPINKQYNFYNTRLSSNIENAFQALAIDEKRITFPPTLWHKTKDGPTKRLEQCWFPGVHGNIGGQAEIDRNESDFEEIGDITFAWMVDNVSHMLTFDGTAMATLVEEHRDASDRISRKNGWGCGPVVDNFDGLIGKFFWLLGQQDRTPGRYPQSTVDGTIGDTNEFFHPVVRNRMTKIKSWNPIALKGLSPIEPKQGETGWTWTNKKSQSLPEYPLRPEKVIRVSHREQDGKLKFGTQPSLSRQLCPKDLLPELDMANGVHQNDGERQWFLAHSSS